MIDWKVKFAEAKLIDAILDRAEGIGIALDDDRLTLEMDLVACHNMGNPLDLEKLLNFDNFNFTHDISGIQNTIDRQTGKLTNFFSPRCSKAEVAA